MLVIAIISGIFILAVLFLILLGERGRILRPSTRKAVREYSVKHILNLKALHGYIYGRWIFQYIKMGINYIIPHLTPGGKKFVADHYHGKVLTPEEAEAIITNKREIPLQDLEQIIPYPLARDLVLSASPDVAVIECACRLARPRHCEPTQVCMVIGRQYTDFILEHHPHTSRRITQEEALEILKAEHERGHVHTAWFKDVINNRFYAICNCCKCCCVGIESMVKYGIPSMISSGYVMEIDTSKCTGCGKCKSICPFGAVELKGNKAVLDWEKCMGCGVCVEHCPSKAIKLVRDEKKGIPLDVRLLEKKEE